MGLSQEHLAERVGVDRSTVVRWERADTEPQPWHRPRLAKALGVSLDELDLLLSDVNVAPGRVTVESLAVTDLREQIQILDQRYDRVPSSSLLVDASRLLTLVSQLRTRRTSSRVRQELLLAEAECSILLGQLIWDASQRRDCSGAKRYFDQAIAAAREVSNPAIEAHAELRKCYVALYGIKDPQQGLHLADRAAHVAAPASKTITGLAHLHAAEAYAMLGDARSCDAMLGAADTEFERVRSDDPAGVNYSPTLRGRLAGSCYLYLGKPAKAESVLHATSEMAAARTKPAAVMLANLALASVRQRNVEASVARLHDALDIVEQTRGGGGLNLVFGVARELQPWRSENVVAEVNDRLLMLMTA